MVHHRSLSDQSRFSSVFHALKIGKLLREARIHKSFGFSALAVFQLLFSLVFEGRIGFDCWKAAAAARCQAKMSSTAS